MIIYEHELAGIRCKHCGGLKTAFEIKATCIAREVPDVAKDATGRRGFAADDADTISTRLAELRAERDAAMNEPPAVSAEPPGLSGTEFDLGECCI